MNESTMNIPARADRVIARDEAGDGAVTDGDEEARACHSQAMSHAADSLCDARLKGAHSSARVSLFVL